MKKLKSLNSTVREWNGLVARFNRDSTPENKEAVDKCLLRLKREVDKILE